MVQLIMSYLEQAQSLSIQDVASVLEERDSLRQKLRWFERQLFGRRSEKLTELDTSVMGDLFAVLDLPEPPKPDEAETEVIDVPGHKRKKRKLLNGADESGLRFSDDVPVKVVMVKNAEYDANPEQFEIIGEKVTYRLAQAKKTYGVIKYVRKTYKRKEDETIVNTPAPENVLDRCVADVSFLAGMLIEKFDYHIPLCRQHRRLEQNGVLLSRSTLMNLSGRAIELLTPIAHAVLMSILSGLVIAMDETPIKFSRSKKGTMKNGYFWPLFGDQKEIYFHFDPSRSTSVIHQVLGDYKGQLLTDGYSAYESYANAVQHCTRSQCWNHARRTFERALDMEKDSAQHAIMMIGALYKLETLITEQQLTGDAKKQYRQTYATPIVDAFFAWIKEQRQRTDLVKSNPLAKALVYASEREQAMRVFLDNPDVPIDTNHLERQIRYIAMGRRAWLFCWTEMGAHQVGIIQTLICTCRLQGVDPYTYLVDVLQRVSTHPASKVHELTPRNWKERFAAAPLRSDFE